MNLIVFLLRSSWVTVAIATFTGGLSGAGSALLIASINAAISNPNQNTHPLLLGFIGLTMITLISGSGSQILYAKQCW